MKKRTTHFTIIAVLALLTLTVSFAGWRAQAERQAGRKPELKNAAAAPVRVAPAPAMFATLTVTNTNDSGAGSLRQAILNSNASVEVDTIVFDLPGAGPHTITPVSPLPEITRPVTIDGTTQPGASCTTPGGLKIELDGTNAGTDAGGLVIRTTDCVVRGLVINRFQDGIRLPVNGGRHIIACNYIGTNVAGTAALPNRVQGLNINTPNNLIGGTTPGDGNLISGNGANGILLNDPTATGNRVEGNLIGTDITGTIALGNNLGVAVGSTSNNVIGGTTPGARNIISGNKTQGVQLDRDERNHDNRIEGNYIGTDITGTADLGNLNFGVVLLGTVNSVVGGTNPAARNVISGNDFSGVRIVGATASGNKVIGNYIGTDKSGTADLGNTQLGLNITANGNFIGGTAAGEANVIAFNKENGVGVRYLAATMTVPQQGVENQILSNSIFANGKPGIDLSTGNVVPLDGLTTNDVGDADTAGGNNLQNFPVLTYAVSANGVITIQSTLNSLPTTSFRIEYFVNDACDASGHGEGQTFLGFQNVTTDGSGNAGLNATFASAVAVGKFITATATRLNGLGAPIETSEFSACVVVSPPLTVQVGDPAVCLDPGGLVGIQATVTNPNNIPLASTFTATLPVGLTAVAGSCAADVNPGGCAIVGNQVRWNGQLPAGQTVNIIYRARIDANAGRGSTFTINNIGNVGGAIALLDYMFTLSCPLTNTRVSDQKPGSVLVFPYYTSAIGGVSDTRMTISNISNAASTLANQAYVHLFFIDGTTCAQADLFLCLTPNASFSFKASEYDPGNTGYLLAVAVDRNGVPVQNNVLVGNAFVRTPTLSDNYGAESFWANSFSVAAVNGNTAMLFFDQVGYDAVPKQFAVEIQSPLDAIGQQIVTAGLSGDLTTSQITGAAQVGTGQVFNEKEQFASFQGWLLGTCQARGTIVTNSPRVPNGLGNLIKTGQAGYLKFNVGGAVGVLLTPRGGAWTGIRTLHKTQTTTTSLTIPVLPPVC